MHTKYKNEHSRKSFGTFLNCEELVILIVHIIVHIFRIVLNEHWVPAVECCETMIVIVWSAALL